MDEDTQKNTEVGEAAQKAAEELRSEGGTDIPKVSREELERAEQSARLKLAELAVVETKVAYERAQTLHALEYLRSAYLLSNAATSGSRPSEPEVK